MFTLPDAIALLAVTLPIAAAIWRWTERRRDNPNDAGGGDAAAASSGGPMASFTGLERRVQAIEIEQRGFREEVRGEFKLVKQMIQFLPSGQRRPGGIGFSDNPPGV